MHDRAPDPALQRTKSHGAARVFLIALVALFCGLSFWYVLPLFVMPSGVWVRRVVRPDPLPFPIRVIRVDGTGLLLEDDRRVTLAGVSMVNDPAAAHAAREILTVACEQGIQIVREVDGEACIVRCELRFWHWCGNDPIDAHYRQTNLNDLLIAAGLAVFDQHAAPFLRPDEAQHLKDIEQCARSWRLGIWSGNNVYRSFGAEPGYGFSPGFPCR